MIQLEVGKSYLRKNGTNCLIVSKSVVGNFFTASGLFYTPEGKLLGEYRQIDIIEEIKQ